MKIEQLRHVIEVANTGSFSQAAKNLYMAQPNLSRSIKELETDLGITIFSRTSKGMVLTSEGKKFIDYAEKILRQLDEVESMYKTEIPAKQTFSISVPRAGYIADAFAAFSNCIETESSEIYYQETTTNRAVRNILEHNYNLGIVRCCAGSVSSLKTMLDEKGLRYELVAEFSYVLVMNQNHPLAAKDSIALRDLEPYIEISYADPAGSQTPAAGLQKEERAAYRRNIYIFERGAQFHLLSKNPETFMWASPLPDDILKGFGLVQRECPENKKIYKDILIHRREYRLSPLDKQFVTELCSSRRRYL